jgi:hypothetical protein
VLDEKEIHLYTLTFMIIKFFAIQVDLFLIYKQAVYTVKYISRHPAEDLRFHSSSLRAKYDYVGCVSGLRKNFIIVYFTSLEKIGRLCEEGSGLTAKP